MLPVQAVGKKGLLTILFIASFTVPIFLGIRYVLPSIWRSEKSEEEDRIFPHRLLFQGHNAYLSIGHNPVLNPKAGQDYIVSAWFKLEDLPEEGRYISLFSRIDNEARVKPGYSLSLIRRGSVIRPVVYWKARDGSGGTYEFSDMHMVPRVWTNFILTLKDGVLLGLHIVEQEPDKKPKRAILGGFRFATPIYATGESTLIFGEKGGDLRGNIGPIGVFSGSGILGDFKEIFRQMSKNPAALTDIFDEKAVMLFSVDGTVDSSEYHHPIRHSPMLEKVNRQEKSERGANQISPQ